MFAGKTITTFDVTPPAADADATTQLNVSDTDPVAWSPVISTEFTGPESGMVMIIVGGGIRDNAANERGLITVEVTDNDTGVSILAPSVTDSSWSNASSTTSNYQYGCRAFLAPNLVAGRRYTAEVMIEVTGGSSVDFFNAQVFVTSTGR